MPKRIQRRREHGWRMPEGAAFVGRPTIWGNPFKPGMASGIFKKGEGLRGEAEILIPSLSLEQCIEFYRSLLASHLKPEMAPYGHQWLRHFRTRVKGGIGAAEWARCELRGRDLACWCPLDQPCHADILLEVSNA